MTDPLSSNSEVALLAELRPLAVSDGDGSLMARCFGTITVLRMYHEEAADEITRLRAALDGLLCEMDLEYDGNRKYDVYQVTKGAVTKARKALVPAQETSDGR